jgi:ribosomal protein S18 acetylase RimI-like enzyme
MVTAIVSSTSRLGVEPARRDIAAGELDAISDLHVAAFSSGVMSQLGHGVVSAFYDWLSRSNFTLAFMTDHSVDGGVCGYAVVTTRPIMRAFIGQNAGKLVWLSLRRPFVLVGLSKLLFPKLWNVARHSHGKMDPNLARLLVIAVHPKFWGKGIGKRLEGQAMDAARSAGFQGLGLTVHPSNTRAIGFYEDLGWEKEFSSGVWTGRMMKHNR